MPAMDGIPLSQQAKQHFPKIPILLIRAMSRRNAVTSSNDTELLVDAKHRDSAEGTVTNQTTGQPVSGAAVTLYGVSCEGLLNYPALREKEWRTRGRPTGRRLAGGVERRHERSRLRQIASDVRKSPENSDDIIGVKCLPVSFRVWNRIRTLANDAWRPRMHKQKAATLAGDSCRSQSLEPTS